jgi:rod shape-determining protein MreD
MILNRAILILVALLLVVLQSTVANVFTIQGAKIELLPALIVYCAMGTSVPTALLVAFCGGIMQDVLSAGRLGLSALSLCGIALVLAQFRLLLFRDFYVIQALLGGFAAFAASLWMVLCKLVAAGQNTVSALTVATIFWVVLTSAVFTPLLFRALDRLFRLMGHKPGKMEAY